MSRRSRIEARSAAQPRALACGAVIAVCCVAAAATPVMAQAGASGAAGPAAVAAAPGERGAGGDALLFIGTYTNSIYVIDEASEAVVDRIPLQNGMARSMVLSHDRQRFYVLDVSFENVEVVDIAARRTVGSFTLSQGNEQVRIWGFNIDPLERFAILLTKSYRRLPDRYEVSGPTLLRYDLQTQQVTDTIAWPEGQAREFAQILFSPDGEHLFFFSGDSTLVYETQGMREVDRWPYEQSLDEGMGRFEFGFPAQPYEQPGIHTGLFRFTDPVQNRRMMGVARVNLTDRSVDFFALGPSEGVSFTLAPGGRRAYGLRQEVGNWEFYTFDLENRRIARRDRFEGRPRMSLLTSSNGRLLYIYNAGNTIDLYDAETMRYLRTIELDADTTTSLFVLPRGGG
jgi:hypothetical protein